MKNTILSSVVTGILLTTPSLSLGANTSSSKGDDNGKPFQELTQLIEENLALIESSQASIAHLENEVAALHARIDALAGNLSDIAAQVAGNTADIKDAFQRLASHDHDIASLRNDLSALALQHNSDISTLTARLDNLDLEIARLSAESLALANLLNQRVAELRALIDNNAVGIDALLLDVIALNAQVTTINSQINSLFMQQSALSGQLALLQIQLANLEAAVNALKLDESNATDPCVANLAVSQSIAGELINNGVCVSAVQTAGGAHAAQFYSFTLAQTTTVRIALQGAPSGNGTLPDPYLYLHLGDRNGQVTRSDDDSGIGYDAQIDMTLQPGIYTIEATSYSASQLGSFLLSLTAP